MNILVTGGAGYIGTHTIVELISAGHSVVVLDNLSNSSEDSIVRVENIIGRKIEFHRCDIRDKEGLEAIFENNNFDCCIHFAGLKSVSESIEKPDEYYENNVIGTITLLDVMKAHNCRNIIFSSSATVYGQPDSVPISECFPKKECTNPYGKTKSIIEDILSDYQREQKLDNVVILRYFNPIGAHPSGLIGEEPKGIPNNLMPYITQVADGQRECLHIFGNDYDTPDGTGIRDYIHVVDLAKGHVKALEAINKNYGYEVYNLGTGKGVSVLELVNAFEAINQVKVPYVFAERRVGDVPVCFADSSKAEKELGWKAQYSIEDMCRHSWNWQQNNS